jgi:hypothetical protein
VEQVVYDVLSVYICHSVVTVSIRDTNFEDLCECKLGCIVTDVKRRKLDGSLSSKVSIQVS